MQDGGLRVTREPLRFVPFVAFCKTPSCTRPPDNSAQAGSMDWWKSGLMRRPLPPPLALQQFCLSAASRQARSDLCRAPFRLFLRLFYLFPVVVRLSTDYRCSGIMGSRRTMAVTPLLGCLLLSSAFAQQTPATPDTRLIAAAERGASLHLACILCIQ